MSSILRFERFCYGQITKNDVDEHATQGLHDNMNEQEANLIFGHFFKR